MHVYKKNSKGLYNFKCYLMHRSIMVVVYNPYNLFTLSLYYSKNSTTSWLLSIGHRPMFVVKSIVIQINAMGYGSINYAGISRESGS